MTKALYLFSRLLQVLSVLGYLFGLIVIGLDLAGELETSGAWISSLVVILVMRIWHDHEYTLSKMKSKDYGSGKSNLNQIISDISRYQ